MAILISLFFFKFHLKKNWILKTFILFFLFQLYSPHCHLYFPHSHPDSHHSHPDSPHSHHSHPDFPHCPHSHTDSQHSNHPHPDSLHPHLIPRIPIIRPIPFPDSSFRLLQIANLDTTF